MKVPAHDDNPRVGLTIKLLIMVVIFTTRTPNEGYMTSFSFISSQFVLSPPDHAPSSQAPASTSTIDCRESSANANANTMISVVEYWILTWQSKNKCCRRMNFCRLLTEGLNMTSTFDNYLGSVFCGDANHNRGDTSHERCGEHTASLSPLYQLDKTHIDGHETLSPRYYFKPRFHWTILPLGSGRTRWPTHHSNTVDLEEGD